MAYPMINTFPSISAFEAAAAAAYTLNPSPGSGLTALLGSNGKPLILQTSDGAVAEAYVDTAGRVIIGYQGTVTAQQLNVDVMVSADTPPNQINALGEALAFVSTVEAAATAQGLSGDSLSVTGYSLGGTLAQYVACETGLPGVSFAGSGIPNYEAPAISPQNFISFVESGDPWGNRASDAALAPITYGMDHYGTLEFIGNSSYNSMSTAILNDAYALVPAQTNGTESQASAKLVSDYNNAFNLRHVDNPYFADIATLSSAQVTLVGVPVSIAADPITAETAFPPPNSAFAVANDTANSAQVPASILAFNVIAKASGSSYQLPANAF